MGTGHTSRVGNHTPPALKCKTMDHHSDVYAAALAVRELRLSSDPSVPPELRDAAGRIERAIVDLKAAGDLPRELEEASMSHSVDVVPDRGSREGQALDGRPPPLWAAYSEVEASLAGFITTVNTVPRMPNESPAYLAAIDSAGLALAGVRWRQMAAVEFAHEGTPLRLVGTDSVSHDPPDRPDPAPRNGLSHGSAEMPSDELAAWHPEASPPAADHNVDDVAQRHDDETARCGADAELESTEPSYEEEEAWHREAALDSGMSGPGI